ncbi:MAG: hypothetical protein AAF561_09115 [Planctomycetota bacterium]
MTRASLIVIALGVLALVSFAIGCGAPFILAFYGVAGWLLYLRRVVPEVEVPLDSVAVAIACVVGIVVLLHVTARWLWSATKADTAPPWRVKYTATGVTGIVLLFACGMAATGAAHQVGWMMQDPGPFWVRQMNERTTRLICQSNQRDLWMALRDYADKNDGKLPPDLVAFVNDNPRLDLNCPHVPGLPYVTYLDGLRDFPDDEDVPLVAEPLANHGGEGMNILFADGEARFVTPEEAASILRRRTTD